MKILIGILLLAMNSYSFTFTSTGRGFDKNTINIKIASTDCTNAGFSTETFRDLVEDAVDDYWNQVASANLKITVSNVSSTDITAQDHVDILDNELVPANSILAGCNEAAFSAGSSTLGSTVMECDGNTCRSVFIINARSDSAMSSINRSLQIATIAHEIGHAIGLGHSEYSHNLMYYKIGGKTQEWLGQDDVDALTYLYPHEPMQLFGCDFPLFGSMGTISDISEDDDDLPPGGFLISAFLSFFLLSYLLRCFNSLPSN